MRWEDRRDEILDAIVAYVVERGRAALSLREAAAAAGISHAALLRHFQTKDRLIEEVHRRLRERAPIPSPDPEDPSQALRDVWAYWIAPEGIPALALQYETLATALRDADAHPAYLLETVYQWLNPVIDSLTTAGCPEPEARVLATEIVAMMRGLLLDFIATRDHVRTTAALENLIARVEHDARSWRPQATEPVEGPQ